MPEQPKKSIGRYQKSPLMNNLLKDIISDMSPDKTTDLQSKVDSPNPSFDLKHIDLGL